MGDFLQVICFYNAQLNTVAYYREVKPKAANIYFPGHHCLGLEQKVQVDCSVLCSEIFVIRKQRGRVGVVH